VSATVLATVHFVMTWAGALAANSTYSAAASAGSASGVGVAYVDVTADTMRKDRIWENRAMVKREADGSERQEARGGLGEEWNPGSGIWKVGPF
jgi:hypothetical protein